MNTADITCVKMTENNNNNNNNNNNKYSENHILATELQVLDERRAKCSKHWYDRVYLCYEDTGFTPSNTYAAIKGFHCYRYDSFLNADRAWWRNDMDLSIRHTMFPICRWVPEIFDRYILNWKLRNMYWGGKITMGRG